MRKPPTRPAPPRQIASPPDYPAQANRPAPPLPTPPRAAPPPNPARAPQPGYQAAPPPRAAVHPAGQRPARPLGRNINVPAGADERPYVVRLPQRRPLIDLAGLGGLSLMGLSALLLLILGLWIVLYAYYQAAERILPRVSAGGVNLAGLSLPQAERALAAGWHSASVVTVSNGIQTQTIAPAELGLSLDPAATARAAFAAGHNQGLLIEMRQLAQALLLGWEVTPVAAFDPGQARRGLETLAPAMSQPPVDATLRLDGTTLIPVPAQIGYTINIDTALIMLDGDPGAVLRTQHLDVLPMPVAAAVTDVTPALAEAQRLLDTPLTIQAYDAISDENLSWPVPREVIATWLRVEAGPNIALDPAAVGQYLENLGGSLGQARYLDGATHAAPLAQALRNGSPYAAVISHRATSYVVQPGDTLLKIGWNLGMPYWMIAQANPAIDPDNISTGTTLVIPSKDQLLPLPVVPGKRVVISISRQRMWIYQNGAQIKEFIISTGIDRSPTQPGVFQVQTHVKNAYASVWDLYMPDFLGIYEAWPGFMNGIHGLPTLSNGRRLWANILGKPASYGCIILDLPNSQWLFDWAEAGTVVEIKP